MVLLALDWESRIRALRLCTRRGAVDMDRNLWLGHALLDELWVNFQVCEVSRSCKPLSPVLAPKPKLEHHDSNVVFLVLHREDVLGLEVRDDDRDHLLRRREAIE